MISLYRRSPTSCWYVNLRLEDGTRIRQSTKQTSRKKAEEVAARINDRIEKVAALDRDGKKSITLGDALELYVDSLRSAGKVSAEGTAATRDKTLGVGVWATQGRFTLAADMWLHELAPLDLERLKQARLKEGNSAQTAKHELSMIRAASRYATDLNFRPAAIANWRMPTTPMKTRYLSWDEFQAVFAAMDPDREFRRTLKSGAQSKAAPHKGSPRVRMQDAQDLLVALAMCGGRWSEVAALTWDRINLAARTVKLYATKADQGERIVAVPDQFLEVLQRRAKARTQGKPLVFPGPRNDAQRKKPTRAIANAMDKAGLNRPDIVARYGRATVHSLRHTFASLLLQGGADLSEVQDSLGHRSLMMTRRYAHLSKGKTLAKLGGIMSDLGSASGQGNAAARHDEAAADTVAITDERGMTNCPTPGEPQEATQDGDNLNVVVGRFPSRPRVVGASGQRGTTPIIDLFSSRSLAGASLPDAEVEASA